MNAEIIYVSIKEDEKVYIFPDFKVIDDEGENFSIDDLGFETILTLIYEEFLCRAGNVWQLIEKEKFEDNKERRIIKLEYYSIRIFDKNANLINEEKFDSKRNMLFSFAEKFDRDKTKINAHCAICNLPLKDFFATYPNPICNDCDERALNVKGKIPLHNSFGDLGDNPVFIDGYKCWRRYRFGGYITMLDKFDCKDIGQFYETTGFIKKSL